MKERQEETNRSITKTKKMFKQRYLDNIDKIEARDKKNAMKEIKIKSMNERRSTVKHI